LAGERALERNELMRIESRNCEVHQDLPQIEKNFRQKAILAGDSDKQIAYEMVAIPCEEQWFRHKKGCSCCAMAVAA
jgi:hypothetical protein